MCVCVCVCVCARAVVPVSHRVRRCFVPTGRKEMGKSRGGRGGQRFTGRALALTHAPLPCRAEPSTSRERSTGAAGTRTACASPRCNHNYANAETSAKRAISLIRCVHVQIPRANRANLRWWICSVFPRKTPYTRPRTRLFFILGYLPIVECRGFVWKHKANPSQTCAVCVREMLNGAPLALAR